MTAAPAETTGITEPAEPVEQGRGFVADLVRYAGMLFAAGVVVLGYEFAFELTKPSPVSRGTGTELLQTLGYVVLLPAILAVVVTPLALGLEALVRLAAPKLPRGVLPLSVVGAVIFVGLLSFLQNLIYSISATGLNRDDDLLLKLAYGIGAGAAAVLLVLRLSRTPDRRWQVASGCMVVLGLPALWVTWQYVADTPDVPTLAESGATHRYNVIVLSADAVEAEHMSAYGYERPTTPFLAEHVGEFMRFENAFTNNGNTTGSIAALLTGRSPLETRIVYPPDQLGADDAQLSLPFLLARLGYRTENWAVPHYADARDQNLARAFDLDNDEQQRGAFLAGPATGVGLAGWFVRDTLGTQKDLVLDVLGIEEMSNPYAQVATVVGDTITDDQRAEGVIDAIGGDRPFFVNTHFMSTHGPVYDDLDDPVFSANIAQTERWQRDFYDDALTSYDDRVKQIYEALERAGKLDDTILVVTSDHGIEYDATKRVPLLIRLPGGAGAGSFAANVERADLAPTVLATLGYAPPSWMTGMNLLDPSSLPADREILATSSSVREFSNNQGFHAGASDVLVTAIRCRWYVQRDPDGKSRSGEVAGSTATCDERPDAPPAYR